MTLVHAAKSESEVLAKAVARAGAGLGLSGDEIASVIGLNRPAGSQQQITAAAVAPTSPVGEAAAQLVRLFLSLDSLTGGDASFRLQWLAAHNTDLGAVPRTLIQTNDGLQRVADYLEHAARGR